MQPLGQKKTRKLLGQKNHGTSWGEKSHNFLGKKKKIAITCPKKSSNIFGQKIMQPLGTNKNHVTSPDKKNQTTSWDKKKLCTLATVLPNYVMVRHLQRQESLFIYITGVNPLLMLLKADPSLEGDVADDNADPSACHQLGKIYVLQYF